MAMNFSETADRMDVRYVAALARISLGDAEAEELQSQLDGILAYVGALKKLDIEGVPAFDDASGVRGAWHEDEPGECLPHDVAMSLAPLERHGQFVVPKIIE